MKRDKNHGSTGGQNGRSSSYFNSYSRSFHSRSYSSSYRSRPSFSSWMYPSLPRHCPHCGLHFMNVSLLGAHMHAHIAKVEEPQRPGSGPLACRTSSLDYPQVKECDHESGGGTSGGGPLVTLGVLEPRVETGLKCPQTLDLLGLGELLEGGNDDSKKAINDLEGHKDGERKKGQKI